MVKQREQRDQFQTIKDNIEQSYEYFRSNYDRFREYIYFVYKSTLNDREIELLNSLNKPKIEFNVLEAYISRLCGEFSKMDPAFEVRTKDGIELTDNRIVQVVEDHLKAAFKGGDQDDLAYQIYKDLLSGGFSVAQIYTDYVSDISFDQKIYIERVFDPTLCGFDPLARQPHKGDGRYCFQLFPKSYDEAVEMFGEEAIKRASQTKYRSDSFNWSYKNQNEDIVLIAEYFCKKQRRKRIVKLTNGHTMTKRDYNRMLERWQEAGHIEQPPQVVRDRNGKEVERMSNIEHIEKYTICGSEILEHVEQTNLDYLPLVFFDGNSEIIRDSGDSQAIQMTRPYIYQAADTQKLKNCAGQTLAHGIENTVQHKWKAAIEGLPDDEQYIDAYKKPQEASVLVYNQYSDGDPSKPVNPPQEIQPVPVPPEVAQAFRIADETIQAILGSYDATIGVNDKDISGKAIQAGATQSNAAATPYTVGFLNGWNRCAQIYLDLLPKYYVTPRTIPIIKANGKRDYYKINTGNNVFFNYEAKSLEVKVEAGVNFAVQKQVALQSIIQLMQASEQFKQFMDEDGLEVLLDNLEIRGIDNLKSMAEQFMKKQKQQRQELMQKQMNQPTQAEIAQERTQLEAQKLQQQAQKDQSQQQLEAAKLAQKEMDDRRQHALDASEQASDAANQQREIELKFIKIMSEIAQEKQQQAIQEERIAAEQTRSAVDMAIDISKHEQQLSDNIEDVSKDTSQNKGGDNG